MSGSVHDFLNNTKLFKWQLMEEQDIIEQRMHGYNIMHYYSFLHTCIHTTCYLKIEILPTFKRANAIRYKFNTGFYG